LTGKKVKSTRYARSNEEIGHASILSSSQLCNACLPNCGKNNILVASLAHELVIKIIQFVGEISRSATRFFGNVETKNAVFFFLGVGHFFDDVDVAIKKWVLRI
jgi:hypothetical protein